MSAKGDVIRDRLWRAKPGVEQWLRVEVGPALDAYRADPGRSMTLDDLRADLAQRCVQAVRRD